MRLVVNGEGLTTAARTVGQLLEELGIEPGRVAVEVNLNVLKRAESGGFLLKEGDSVEVVYYVGGG